MSGAGAPWWQRDLDAHRQRDGRCPVCDVPYRCWPWATARAVTILAAAGPGQVGR